MRKIFFGLMMALVFVFSAMGYAETTQKVSVAWDYDDPPADLAGFELRVNGDNSTLIHISKDMRMWGGVLTLSDSANVLDMRAVDLAGQYSDWSEPSSVFDPLPKEVQIKWILFEQP
jgi:hypothetical protein